MEKKRRAIITIMVFFVISAPALAESITISKNVTINLDNGAYIKILAPQKVSHITIRNSTGNPASTVQFWINDTQINYTSNANKTLWDLSYNNITDIANYNGSGTSGHLIIDVKMKNATSNYTLKVDSVPYNTSASNSQGWVRYNYSDWSQHTFQIAANVTITVTEAGGNVTTMTFLDVTCLNLGLLCTSKIYVYQNDTLAGELASNGSFMRINQSGAIKIVLKPSMATVLNNPEGVRRQIEAYWVTIFAVLFLLGLIETGYYIVKKSLKERL